jgi:hypothetical protein
MCEISRLVLHIVSSFSVTRIGWCLIQAIIRKGFYSSTLAEQINSDHCTGGQPPTLISAMMIAKEMNTLHVVKVLEAIPCGGKEW